MYSSSDYSSYNATPASASFGLQGMMATIMGIISTFLILIIVVVVLMVVGQWKAYQKAGRKGYESLIPFHRDWVQLRLAGMEGYWVFLLCLTCIPVVGWLVDLGVRIWWDIELAKSYGQSAGFGVGLALLPCIFWPILGFGKAQYVGPADKANNGTQTVAQPVQAQTTFTQPAATVMPSDAANTQQATVPQQNATFPQANAQPTMPTQPDSSTTFGDQNSQQ